MKPSDSFDSLALNLLVPVLTGHSDVVGPVAQASTLGSHQLPSAQPGKEADSGDRDWLQGRFSAGSCLLAAIESALSQPRCSRIEVIGSGMLWLNPQARVWHARISDPTSFFRTPAALAKIHYDVAFPISRPHGNIDELLWQAGYFGSDGRLLDRGHPLDMVELRYWPNLTRLPHTPCMVRMCALLARAPSTVLLACRMLRVTPQEAWQFYSAALAAGMIQVVCPHYDGLPPASTPVAELPVLRRMAGLWERLLERISDL